MTEQSLKAERAGRGRRLDIARGTVEMTHGSGGRASAQLIGELFAKHLTNEWLAQGHDGAVMPPITHPVAMSCDAHVVKPLFFPGGDIGRLAVTGTVNDVAMCGAKPLWISAAFILEEGFPLADLERIVESMAEAAREAGVAIVTGDTKVVEKGHGDGCYIATTGVGERIADHMISGASARPGDAVLVSGSIGDHGMTVMSLREDMSFGTSLVSDAAPLAQMVANVIAAAPHVHVLRDPTRGGLGTTLNEIAAESRVGITLEEKSIPVKPEVRAACEFLGLDPLYSACEGRLICIVPADEAEAALAAMRSSPYGEGAARVGTVTDTAPGFVEMVTLMGGRRMVDWLTGEQLPRIC
ncbi:hydrogenase expression/formation protein HypE [Sutterella sp.]|uniref:hydrogenase expression/formation protein HypE n=1 Tax=Sutterella sp. TaxID=1981025 RepID=UPI0026E08784|nr:hydrogenase expression/formation protein HypE [Sutterella sp.]MDO5530923.1 hydrogenase expression/formation protein HypE [Sutterella sp.]